MASELKLQNKFEELLGTKQVYYQPPESMQMSYPAIRYSKKKPDVRYANDKKYSKMDCYEVIVMDFVPDNPVIEKILELPYTSHDRVYVSDNLNHDVITIFY